MARTQIATVKLLSGQGNFFDELTRIHLTAGNPTGAVYSGMNLTNIRRAVRSGRIVVINGSLGPDPSPYKLVRQDKQYVLTKNKHTDTPKVAAVKTEAATTEPESTVETNVVEPEVTTLAETSDTIETNEVPNVTESSDNPLEESTEKNEGEEANHKRGRKKALKPKIEATVD